MFHEDTWRRLFVLVNGLPPEAETFMRQRADATGQQLGAATPSNATSLDSWLARQDRQHHIA